MCSERGMIPNNSEGPDSRFWIVSVAISLHSVTVKRNEAHTALTSTSEVLRTIVRMRAMVREILETSEQGRGRAMMGKDCCKASPSG
jgi:hypothetical protein